MKSTKRLTILLQAAAVFSIGCSSEAKLERQDIENSTQDILGLEAIDSNLEQEDSTHALNESSTSRLFPSINEVLDELAEPAPLLPSSTSETPSPLNVSEVEETETTSATCSSDLVLAPGLNGAEGVWGDYAYVNSETRPFIPGGWINGLTSVWETTHNESAPLGQHRLANLAEIKVTAASHARFYFEMPPKDRLLGDSLNDQVIQVLEIRKVGSEKVRRIIKPFSPYFTGSSWQGALGNGGNPISGDGWGLTLFFGLEETGDYELTTYVVPLSGEDLLPTSIHNDNLKLSGRLTLSNILHSMTEEEREALVAKLPELLIKHDCSPENNVSETRVLHFTEARLLAVERTLTKARIENLQQVIDWNTNQINAVNNTLNNHIRKLLREDPEAEHLKQLEADYEKALADLEENLAIAQQSLAETLAQ